jgi:hypothetical protein
MTFFGTKQGIFIGDLVYKDILFAYYPSTDLQTYLDSLEKYFGIACEESVSSTSLTGYKVRNLNSYARSI